MDIYQAKYKGRDLSFTVRPTKQSDLSVIQEVLERNEYEKYGVKLQDSKVWLDCGAHIGTFAAAACVEGCRVYCFEPHPENYLLLRRNLKTNCLTSVKCREAALLSQADVASRGAQIPLHLAPKSTSFHSTIQPFRNGTSVQVKAVPLEAFLRKHPEIEGIKLDCEGEEMPILENLLSEPLLLENIAQIVFEWDFKRDRRTDRLRQVIKRLQEIGFEVSTRQTKVFQVEEWTFWPSGVLVYAKRCSYLSNHQSPP
jgi:FkbM family methyltransferase